jgi:shikimate kinase
MKLAVEELWQKYRSQQLHLSLIGMSNIGKTYWSRQLEACCHFRRVEIDQEIEKALEPELKRQGYQGIQDLAKWMGFPDSEHFEVQESRYLELEGQSLKQVLDQLQKTKQGNEVLDTTGSVIYLDPLLKARLKALTVIVYLQAPSGYKEGLFQRFLAHPKPVVWKGKYSPRSQASQDSQAQETREEALARCYGELLDFREKSYEQYADVILPLASLSPQEGGVSLLKQLGVFHETL